MPDRPLIFVNYRRDDSQEWATLIVESLQRQLGRDAVFVNTESIQAGDEWPQKIERALDQATVLLTIIGPQWMAIHDESWRRRIDLGDDWVRHEIEHALGKGTPLISVLVSGASPLRGESLPPSLVDLPNRQFIRLEDKADIRALVELLTEDFGFRAINTELDYPTPVDRQPEMPEAELAAALRKLPEWSRIERGSSRGKRGTAVELERVYKFKTFSDAIHFMATTARYIRVTGHHPWWENQYKDLRVRLTTWDVGMRITWKDIRLAQYLDRQYREYVAFDRGNRPELDA